MIKIGVIGYGYWGPNLVRTFAEAQLGTIVAVSDLDPKKPVTVSFSADVSAKQLIDANREMIELLAT